jgi:aspartate carbamoyltransferase catalytic subunit
MSATQRPRHLLSVADLSDGEVLGLLARADELAIDPHRAVRIGAGRTMALLFLSSSLRTRVGHARAGVALGFSPISIDELRFETGMTSPESFRDSLRVVSGMSDLVVARTPFPIDRATVEQDCLVPFVNGGDGWNEHPTQALIDLYAITRLRGDIAGLRVGIVGDMRLHVSRSLVRLLERFPPRELRLIAPAGRGDLGLDDTEQRHERTTTRDRWDTADLDVVYLAGLPEGQGSLRLDEVERAAFALTKDRAEALDPEAIVLCPLPRIDEITDEARGHPQVKAFAQSDAGTAVRMAILEVVMAPERAIGSS